MTITSKATKAQILEAYEAQRAILEGGASWPQVWAKIQNTASTVSREAAMLVTDCYKAGQAARRCYDWVMAELSQPITKARS